MTLAVRSTREEAMDTGCDGYDDYARCLRDLSRVNVVTLTHRPMLAWLRRQATPGFSLLDIACGHGDALRAVRRQHPDATLTGIDLNPWAVRAAAEATPPDARIRFIHDDAFAYRPETPFDFIITSQFTHHLTDDQIVEFLTWLGRHAAKGWFISDLHRHWLPYYGFPVLARAAFWHHFVRTDGQISIARSFRPAEWKALLQRAGLSGQASITWHIPFRLCVSHP